MQLSEEAGFGRSLFERLSSLGHSKHLLNVQYRMHPEISWFPNSKFYRNQILDAPNVQSESYDRCYLQGSMFGPFSFINVCDGREESDEVGQSKRNLVEVSVTLKLVQKLFEGNPCKEEPFQTQLLQLLFSSYLFTLQQIVSLSFIVAGIGLLDPYLLRICFLVNFNSLD